MKTNIIALSLAAFSALTTSAATQIPVLTPNTALILEVGDNGRVYQRYFGKKLANAGEYEAAPRGAEAYLTHGMEDYFEPALHINHADDNPSTELRYVSHSSAQQADGSTLTTVKLTDKEYGTGVDLNYVTYPDVDIIKSYTVITNGEKKPVEMEKYASSLLHFDRPAYYLTQFNGDWISETTMSEAPLSFGKKVLDTKLGSRENMFVSPFFQLSLDEPARDEEGEMLVGTLAWTGNFRFTFEVDNLGKLRVISGINPYASKRILAKGESFQTPEFIFTLSEGGRGEASRTFHDWARKYQVNKGEESRMTLLNNWEATYFDFDEEKLVKLIGEAKELGVDMFLLDDGWFGNKYPRHSDTQGLGDWDETANKLPNGIGRLTEEAKKQGIKFGLWIEPEMVSHKSELYEKHKDWVITLPNRDEYYFRNQLVLDLSNPQVQDYVFGIVDNLMTKYPDIAFFKWDCNSPITNIYSNYLKDKQSHLYVDYTNGLYKVLDRIKAKYPDLVMMMCSGGGGRTDYEGLRYFTEFWCSDNTDPVDRLYIQWGYSQIFPAKTQCAHVTTWNKTAPVKFRTDVAMMGKLGFDINLHDLSADDLKYCQNAIRYYNRLKSVILDGDQYRLVSPYSGNHASTMYVGKDKKSAVVFAFDIFPKNVEHNTLVKLRGLNPDATYSVKEINRADTSDGEVKTYSGDYLMKVGLPLFGTSRLNSRIYELTQN